MRDNLIKEVQPLINDFVDKLIKLYVEVEQVKEELLIEIGKIKKEQGELNAQKAENEKRTLLAINKLEEERAKQTELQDQIKDELTSYSNLKKEYDQKMAKADEYLISAEIDRDLMSGSLDKSKKIQIDYEAKFKALQSTEEKNLKDRQILDEKRRSIEIEHSVVDKKKAEIETKLSELNDKELKIKAQRQEVDRLIKHFHLEEKIKNKG